MAELQRVNDEVNRLPYRADIDLYGRPDFWEFVGVDGGDCEDFALAKQRALAALGWPAAQLRLALCVTEAGESHCVLTVDFQRATWVLDNRRAEILPWDDCGYRWTQRQAAGGPGWVQIEGEG